MPGGGSTLLQEASSLHWTKDSRDADEKNHPDKGSPMDWERLSTTLIAVTNPSAIMAAREKHADYPQEQAEKLAFDELAARVVAFLCEQQEFAGNLMFFTGGHSFQA